MHKPRQSAALKSLLCVAATVLLTACATLGVEPEQVRTNVGTFASGVETATTIFREEQQRFVQVHAALARNALEANLSPVRQNRGQCRRASRDFLTAATTEGLSSADYAAAAAAFSEACAIERQRPQIAGGDGGDWVPLTLEAGETLPRHNRLAQALDRYAASLRELSQSAQDRQAFDEAATGAKDSLLAFVQAAMSETGRSFEFGNEANVIGSAINGAIGAALEAKRQQAITDVVVASQPAIQAAADVLAAATRSYHAGAVPDLRERLIDAVRDTTEAARNNDAAKYKSALDDAVAAQQLLITYINTDPGFSFVEMAKAHDALGKQLADPEISPGRLAGQVEYFLTTSRDVLDAVRSVSRKVGGGPPQ